MELLHWFALSVEGRGRIPPRSLSDSDFMKNTERAFWGGGGGATLPFLRRMAQRFKKIFFFVLLLLYIPIPAPSPSPKIL